MSKGPSYLYSGTKGHIIEVIANLPPKGSMLLAKGWQEISHPAQAATGHHEYEELSTGLCIRFDKAIPGAKGYKGKDHFHIYNPNATSDRDKYLDKYGNPVKKNSAPSHIFPKGAKQT